MRNTDCVTRYVIRIVRYTIHVEHYAIALHAKVKKL